MVKCYLTVWKKNSKNKVVKACAETFQCQKTVNMQCHFPSFKIEFKHVTITQTKITCEKIPL